MLLESQHLPSNLGHNWLGSIGILPAGLLESQQLRSNLDQDWLRGMRIVAVRYARITAVSVKSGSRLAERYGDSIRWYARITAVSVKSGSKLAERYGDSNSMPGSQQCRSNLDQNWGKYWHTTSRYARITRPSVKSGTKLAEQY